MAATSLRHSTTEGLRRLAVIIDTALRLQLAERGTIRQTGAVVYAGSVNGMNSDSTDLSYVGLDGFDSFSTMGAEDSTVGITDVDMIVANIAVARGSFARDTSDLFQLTGPEGSTITPERLATSMVGEYDQYWMEQLAAAVALATTNVGSGSGNPMTVDDAFDALYTLELNVVPGPWDALLHPVQSVDFKNDLRTETGALAFDAATPEMMKASGDTLIGSWMGATWWKSSKVTSAAGAREGAMWGRGGVAWKDGTVNDLPTDTVVVRPDAAIFVEFARTGRAALTEIIGHCYLGQSITEQGRVVGILTDAA